MVDKYKQCIRRKVVFLRRNREKNIKSMHISNAQLKSERAHFETVVNKMYQEMQRYSQTVTEADCGDKTEFTDYRILSFNGDRMGKVFKKDGRIYRGIYAESCEGFMRLWHTGLLQVLGKYHLIPVTTISEYTLPDYPLILAHETVSMWPSGLWNDSMTADACVLISLIRQVAQTVGYTLHDGHLNNVTFHHGKPVFTDIGSIVEDCGQKTACDREIVFSGCFRLLFEQLGNTVLSRNQVYDENNNLIWIAPRYYDELTREYYYCYKAFKRFHLFHSSATTKKIVRSVFEYYDIRPEYISLLFGSSPVRECAPEYAEMDQVIEEISGLSGQISSVVDIGGTAGVFPAKIASMLSVKVYALEYNKRYSEEAYRHCRQESGKVDTLLFHYLYGASADIRDSLRADVAVAFDITHNILTYQQYRMDSLLNSLAKLTRKYAVISYYPYRSAPTRYIRKLDEYGRECIDEFKRAFEQFFITLSCREYSNLGDGTEEDLCLIFVGKIRNEEAV